MSVLAHVVLGGPQQNEPAATQALAYILNSKPAVAEAFTGILKDAGFDFAPGRIVAELEHEESRPDLTIRDSRGDVRVFVENKFWAGLTDAQPVSYLDSLSDDPPSALVFIVPAQRVSTVWNELRARCNRKGLGWVDVPNSGAVTSARIGRKTMLIASWDHVLKRLLHAADSGSHDDTGRDIRQLQGLTSQMDAQAFLPLRVDEVTDQKLARRMINFSDLVEPITTELRSKGIVDTKGLNPTHGYFTAGRYLRVHGKIVSWFGVRLNEWRIAGITPLWWSFSNQNAPAELFKTDPELLKDTVFDDSGQHVYVPIRLKTGVERDQVVENAVEQMTRIANHLLEKIRNN